MPSILLISRQPSFQETITEALPAGWKVDRQYRDEEIRGYLKCNSIPENGPLFILVDMEERPFVLSLIRAVQPENSFIYGLINDPCEQEAVFMAGGDDYLLKSKLSMEVRGRLLKQRSRQEMFQGMVQQLTEKESQACAGRLTSYICHEINNAMQATRGALSLALEEPNLAEDISSYLNLCQQETQRVVNLIERLRQTYRPQEKGKGPLRLNELFMDVINLASEDLGNHNVSLAGEIGEKALVVDGVYDQIHLALLGSLLTLGEAIGLAGGGILKFRMDCQDQFISLDFFTDLELNPIDANLMEIALPKNKEGGIRFFTLKPSRDLITANHGELILVEESSGSRIQIRFPALDH